MFFCVKVLSFVSRGAVRPCDGKEISYTWVNPKPHPFKPDGYRWGGSHPRRRYSIFHYLHVIEYRDTGYRARRFCHYKQVYVRDPLQHASQEIRPARAHMRAPGPRFV